MSKSLQLTTPSVNLISHSNYSVIRCCNRNQLISGAATVEPSSVLDQHENIFAAFGYEPNHSLKSDSSQLSSSSSSSSLSCVDNTRSDESATDQLLQQQQSVVHPNSFARTSPSPYVSYPTSVQQVDQIKFESPKPSCQFGNVDGGLTNCDVPSTFLTPPYSIPESTYRHPALPSTRGSVLCGPVGVKLCDRDLWLEFHKHTTEMIITKQGRRMFPILKFRLSGLDPYKQYSVFVDMVRVDSFHWKFQQGKWISTANQTNEVNTAPFVTNRYIHPDSPATGEHWLKSEITYNKLKLTNNKDCKDGGLIRLNSMQKYLPRIHVAESFPDGAINEKSTWTHAFKETEFIAVTAYQNTDVTQLKIDYNPFAKGFRDTADRSFRTTTPSPPSLVLGPPRSLRLPPGYSAPSHYYSNPYYTPQPAAAAAFHPGSVLDSRHSCDWRSAGNPYLSPWPPGFASTPRERSVWQHGDYSMLSSTDGAMSDVTPLDLSVSGHGEGMEGHMVKRMRLDDGSLALDGLGAASSCRYYPHPPSPGNSDPVGLTASGYYQQAMGYLNENEASLSVVH